MANEMIEVGLFKMSVVGIATRCLHLEIVVLISKPEFLFQYPFSILICLRASSLDRVPTRKSINQNQKASPHCAPNGCTAA